MKKIIILLGILLAVFAKSVSADGVTVEPSVQTVTLSEVKEMIRQKEDFYLYIGRSDYWQADESYEKVVQAATQEEQTIYYLDTSGIDAKAYKSFAKKYQIKSVTYLAHFSQRKQLASLSTLESQSTETILAFFTQ